MNPSYSPLNTEEVDAPVSSRDVNDSNVQPSTSAVQVDPSVSSSPPPVYDGQGWSYAPEPATAGMRYGTEALPSYDAVTKLPTYDDVEKQKLEEARMEIIDAFFGSPAEDTQDDEPRLDGILVGTDCMFFFAFIVAFFFNWVGLFIGYFFMFSLAGRYGAIAGFGTSMIKWLVYLRYSNCCQDISFKDNVYIYMALNLLAFFIIFKGVHSWLRVRPYMNQSNGGTSRRSTSFQ